MALGSLKGKLLVGVCILVICSGVLISLVVTHRYSRNLHEALSAQAQYLANAISLQTADMVLTNDLVALQKLLDHQLSSHPSLSYLFILKDARILAHTFQGGVPLELLDANEPVSESWSNLREIVSTRGDYYLDVAVPIFQGKAGTLRLGFSENVYRAEIARLWAQIGLLTLAILLLAILGGLLFVRRITGPLMELARAADRVNRGEPYLPVSVKAQDEVAAMANSFNNMVERLQSYTRRLEDQSAELDRAHRQTRSFCGIVQEIGSLQTLREIGTYLITTFKSILGPIQMAFLMLNDSRDTLFLTREHQAVELKDPGLIQGVSAFLDGRDVAEPSTFTGSSRPMPLLISEVLQLGDVHVTIPLVHEKGTFGVLFVCCSGGCRCAAEDIHLVGTVLNQSTRVLRRAMLHEEEIRELQSRLQARTEFCGILSKNPRMQSIFSLIEDIAPTDATVLIQGESGTGKELVARAIHEKSGRNGKAFIVIDCSAYPSTLLESELFGHEKGAFTGAIRQKSGRFEQADGGTVFLDEIGEIPLPAQIKLLRVLQTHQFERLGGEQTLSMNLRVIAATNRNLLDEVKRGHFREDLYYRLNVIPIQLPPLRERRNDIPMLARHFLRRFAAEHGKKIEGLSPESMGLLLDYPWPGNVRELENTLEHAVVLVKSGRIGPVHLPSALHAFASSSQIAKPSTMAENESRLLQATMEDCGWNKREAARRLGISRSTLYEKLKKFGIAKPTSH